MPENKPDVETYRFYSEQLDIYEALHSHAQSEAVVRRSRRNKAWAAYGTLMVASVAVQPLLNLHPDFVERSALSLPAGYAAALAVIEGHLRKSAEIKMRNFETAAVKLADAYNVVPPSWAMGQELPSDAG